MGDGQLVDLVGRADAEIRLVSGGLTARVGQACCVHFALPHRWATQGAFTHHGNPPTSEQVRQATGWLEQQSPGSWLVVVRAEHAGTTMARCALRTVDQLGVWTTRDAVDVPPPQGVEIGPARSVSEVLHAYGEVLEPLVRRRTSLPDDAWLVARQDGAVVACARVRVVVGTAYVSAVTVRQAARGQGIGRATSAAATVLALQRSPLAWLHCADAVSPLYAGLGYRRLTTHVQLSSG